jgi:hypothetical protein
MPAVGVQAAFCALPCALGRRSGCQLLNATENALVIPKPKHTLLPLLTLLFLISYGLMTLLIVEQGRIIDAQRYLIRQLFGDSSQLAALQGKATQKQNAEAQAQAEAKAHSQAQAPPSQVTPRDNAKSDRKARKLRRPAPQKPPTDASDTADERRTLISI